MGIVVILIAITIVIGIFHHKIVDALIPAANWVKKTPAGFLIPIALLIILSIPPVSMRANFIFNNAILTSCKQLFGAEIIHLLCGFTYGLWIGFLILSSMLSAFSFANHCV